MSHPERDEARGAGHANVEPTELIRKIDHLLRMPVSSNHINFLRWVRKKAEQSDLVEFDRNYALYLWEEFGPPASARKAEVHGPKSSIESANERPKGQKTSREQRPIPAFEETELTKAKQTIARLRELGKRAVAQREEWQAVATRLEQELTELRKSKPHHKFEEAKKAFAKLYHPNASLSQSPLEATLRAEIFKEFWAELERIDAI